MRRSSEVQWVGQHAGARLPRCLPGKERDRSRRLGGVDDGSDDTECGRLRLLRTLQAVRYVTPLREGGSLPAVVEAEDEGLYVVKFRGAGKGARALVAELVCGELARAVGLAPEAGLSPQPNALPVPFEHRIAPRRQTAWAQFAVPGERALASPLSSVVYLRPPFPQST